MVGKLSIVILLFLSFVFIVQGNRNPEDLSKYYNCWINNQCLSDEEEAQKLRNCFMNLKPEELKTSYMHVKENYSHYKSDNVFDAINEFCHLDDTKRQKAYQKSAQGMIDILKMVCSDSDKASECSRVKDVFHCLFVNMNQQIQEGKCTKDVNAKGMP
ncbi:uncharacterized protein LOC129975252 [Argiope bruennichi]|uniref:uncharacterized protein LOC129975252 n=1 Tax=Argiope bruennichi TaxID=94029 RepID=UPI00249531AB|nr:uncharacterized protein LOC129975252 [Argiope bruennichi]